MHLDILLVFSNGTLRKLRMARHTANRRYTTEGHKAIMQRESKSQLMGREVSWVFSEVSWNVGLFKNAHSRVSMGKRQKLECFVCFAARHTNYREAHFDTPITVITENVQKQCLGSCDVLGTSILERRAARKCTFGLPICAEVLDVVVIKVRQIPSIGNIKEIMPEILHWSARPCSDLCSWKETCSSTSASRSTGFVLETHSGKVSNLRSIRKWSSLLPRASSFSCRWKRCDSVLVLCYNGQVG